MPNSTVLVNLQLQIQDTLNPGNTPVNRIVPQFSFPSSGASIFSGYQFVQPTGGFPFTIFNFVGLTPVQSASVVYVRNAGQSGVVVVSTQTNAVANNFHALDPGGMFLYCSAINNVDEGILKLTVENDTAAAILFEYLYAY